MLTLKVIGQDTEKVLKGLEKKHFKNAFLKTHFFFN